MSKLLYKEFRLAMHPTAYIFLSFSLMLLIPNYPYYVTFFYTGLAVFFTCLGGRENHDIFYTLSLPVPKRAAVKARFASVMLIELAQLLLAIPFAFLRQLMPGIPGNQVGMDANIAFFGLALILLGIFNLIFFSKYYKNTDKVGSSFGISSIAVFVYIIIVETLTHIIPFFRDRLDTKDTEFVADKLLVLAIGIIIYLVLTLVSFRKSVKSFEKLDL